MNRREKIIIVAEALRTEKNTTDHFNHLLRSIEKEVNPNEFLIIKDSFEKKLIPTVIEDIYNVLDNNLDEESIDAFITFYNSDFGKLLMNIGDTLNNKIAELNQTKWKDILQDTLMKLLPGGFVIEDA